MTDTTRRLAAILFSDIVGYTAAMGSDEERAIDAVERSRRLQKRLVEQHTGEWLQEIGDGALAVFPSCVEAAACALEIQETVRGDPDLSIRIGIHEGDVVFHGKDIFGDGVNVAARLQAIAEPGGICVSARVYDELRNKRGIRGNFMGEKELKNVNRRVRVYAIAAGDGARAGASLWTRVAERLLPHRKAARLTLAAAVTLVLAFGLFFQNRHAIMASMIVNIPLLLPPQVEQEIGFTTAADGVRIAYATSGEGPALVHSLGWFTHLESGMNSATFSFLPLGRWQDDYYIVRFDGRGTGLSDRNIQDFSLDARVSDLEAVIEALDPAPFTLYAHSAGGPAAVAYTARHPERVTRLVFYGAFARIADSQEREDLIRSMIPVVRTGWGLDTPAFREMFTSLFMPDGSPVQRRVFTEFQHRSANGDDVANFLESQFDIDVRQQAAGIGVPTLVIHVDGDRIVPYSLGRELAAAIPGAKLVTIHGDDHVMQQGSPGDQEAIEAIEAFFEQTDPQAGV